MHARAQGAARDERRRSLSDHRRHDHAVVLQLDHITISPSLAQQPPQHARAKRTAQRYATRHLNVQPSKRMMAACFVMLFCLSYNN
jgi:hypothetical protein